MSDLLAEACAYMPKVEGEATKAPVLVCGGMGGSSLPVRVARFLGATPYLIAHKDYGLPERAPEGAHYVALSYSGDTAETLSFAEAALAGGLPLSIVASGGALLALAKERGLPYVTVPVGLVPREAVLSMTKALLALMGEEALLEDASFDEAGAERSGIALAALLEGRVPVFYASARNVILAELAKILMNETAKTPAFANELPEANHNEMQGFGSGSEIPFVAVFLKDATDDSRVVTRMRLTETLLAEQGIRTETVPLPEGPRAETFLYAWWLARTAARSLAAQRGLDPDATPLIDSFKKML